jgi:DNA-binding NarL/FixJ family response regulator
MTEQISIIVADDHPLFRTALRNILEIQLTQPDIIEAEDFPTLQNKLEKRNDFSLILLDLHMPGAEGFSALVFLIAQYPHIPVMIVSGHEEPEIMRRAIGHGACGFLPKSSSASQMSEALTQALNGGLWLPADINNHSLDNESELNIADSIGKLTPQQFRVSTMVSQGLLNKQIAYELNVTEATIKAHMTEIFRKLGVHSRTQAAVALSQLAVNPNSSIEEFKKTKTL